MDIGLSSQVGHQVPAALEVAPRQLHRLLIRVRKLERLSPPASSLGAAHDEDGSFPDRQARDGRLGGMSMLS